MNERNLIPLARDFALKAHEGEMVSTVAGFRRPQILHLQEVADLVWISGGTDDEVAAAWLHDAIEDTPVTKDDIAEKLGNHIAEIVQGLTDPKEFATLSLAERKQKQAARLKNESQNVRRIKISDQVSNIRALMDPTDDMTRAEWNDYLEGSRLIARECQGVSPLLDALFLKIYEEGKEILKKRGSLAYREQKFYAGGFLYNSITQSVLLHKRDSNTPVNPNKWAFFGGLNETGETPLQTFLREIKEELNVNLSQDVIKPLCDYLNEELQTYRYIFFVESSLKKSEMNLGEGEDFDWIPLEKVFEYDLTEKTNRDLKKFLEVYKL